MREAEIAEKAYETAMQRAVSARVDSRANLTNISVLNPAVAPIKPIRPRLAMNLALALVVGTLLGLTTIYLMEMFDRRVRSTNDLENALNIPYLGEFNAWQPQAGRLLGPPHLMQTLPGPG
jgi:capsular polysaccharide biosynthesis protein